MYKAIASNFTKEQKKKEKMSCSTKISKSLLLHEYSKKRKTGCRVFFAFVLFIPFFNIKSYQ